MLSWVSEEIPDQQLTLGLFGAHTDAVSTVHNSISAPEAIIDDVIEYSEMVMTRTEGEKGSMCNFPSAFCSWFYFNLSLLKKKIENKRWS